MLAKLKLQTRIEGISRPSAVIAAHRERSKSIQTKSKRKRSESPVRSPKAEHIQRLKSMRNLKRQKQFLEITQGTVSLHNDVKNRLSLKKGLQLAETMNLKVASPHQLLLIDTVVRVIAPIQPRGPLSRVNGMVGKVAGFREKGGSPLVIVNINIGGKTSRYYVPYSYIMLDDMVQ